MRGFTFLVGVLIAKNIIEQEPSSKKISVSIKKTTRAATIQGDQDDYFQREIG